VLKCLETSVINNARDIVSRVGTKREKNMQTKGGGGKGGGGGGKRGRGGGGGSKRDQKRGVTSIHRLSHFCPQIDHLVGSLTRDIVVVCARSSLDLGTAPDGSCMREEAQGGVPGEREGEEKERNNRMSTYAHIHTCTHTHAYM